MASLPPPSKTLAVFGSSKLLGEGDSCPLGPVEPESTCYLLSQLLETAWEPTPDLAVAYSLGTSLAVTNKSLHPQSGDFL